MRLLVLGASGRTGRLLVAAALAEGHEVSVLVRNAALLGEEAARARLFTGSATDEPAVERACAAQQAVLCALGPRSARELLKTDLMQASIGALMPSMQRHGCKRVVLLSALGAGASARCAPLASRVAFRTLLRRVGEDKKRAEEALRASALDWTIVYPPSLTDGPANGRYRHGEDLRPSALAQMSRADVADFMLAQLGDERYSRRGVVIGP